MPGRTIIFPSHSTLQNWIIPEQTGLVKRTIGFLLFDRETFRKKLRKRMKRMSNEQ